MKTESTTSFTVVTGKPTLESLDNKVDKLRTRVERDKNRIDGLYIVCMIQAVALVYLLLI